MEIKQYYEKLINNQQIDKLNQDLYFDYQGEGYDIRQFPKVNPLVDIQKHEMILEYFNDTFGFAFYKYEKDNQQYKAMDILQKKDGEFTDHYLCHNVLEDESQVTIINHHNQEINEEDTYEFMKRFWQGEDVKYSETYVEHSSFSAEINYENIIEVHSVNNYLVMLCDAKINGLYGTLADLYVIENEQFIEHWDVFTVDKVQPEEPEFIC